MAEKDIPAPAGGEEAVAYAYEWAPFNHEQWQSGVSEKDPLVHGGARRYRNVRPIYVHPARATTAETRIAETAKDVLASLVAAVSLLKRAGKHGKHAAPSDAMFDQMIVDYEASITRARSALALSNKPMEKAR